MGDFIVDRIVRALRDGAMNIAYDSSLEGDIIRRSSGARLRHLKARGAVSCTEGPLAGFFSL